MGHLILPELRGFSQYGDICVDNAKAFRTMRGPRPVPEERACIADRSPPHGISFSTFTLLQSVLRLAGRRTLGGLKSGLVAGLDWSFCTMEVGAAYQLWL